MTNQTSIRFNLKGLEDLQKQFGSDYRARVGILGAHAPRKGETKDSINNAELGLIMIFGSLSKKIPPRDFLITPIIRQAREIIAEVSKKVSFKNAVKAGDVKKAYGILGAVAEKFVDVAFQTGGFGQWPPNSPATIAAKTKGKGGVTSILIDTGQLRASITSDVSKK